MGQMRADMGGAACTVGALYTIAKLNMPAHVKGNAPINVSLRGRIAGTPLPIYLYRKLEKYKRSYPDNIFLISA